MASTTLSDFEPLTGHCTCKAVTYKLTAPPLVTHCCHCTWCQRETGTAFVLNAQVEAYNFHLTSNTQPLLINIPSPSGEGVLNARCPTCYIAVYSHYGGNKNVMFVKVGSLSDGSRERVKPDVHIFTSTKMDWVDLRSEKERGIGVYEEYYKREDVWSKESLERRDRLLEWMEEKKKQEDAK